MNTVGTVMTKPACRKKRSKFTILLLSPLLLLVFLTGWNLYCIRQPWQQNTKPPQTAANNTPKKDEAEFSTIAQEGQIIVN